MGMLEEARGALLLALLATACGRATGTKARLAATTRAIPGPQPRLFDTLKPASQPASQLNKIIGISQSLEDISFKM